MPTLEELLKRIESHTGVISLEKIEEHPPYYFYRVRMKIDEETIRETAVCIYVDKNGNAYFKGANPVAVKQVTALELKLRQMLTQEHNAVKIESISINKEEGYAVASAFVLNQDGTVSRKNFLAYLDENGNLVVHEIVTPP